MSNQLFFKRAFNPKIINVVSGFIALIILSVHARLSPGYEFSGVYRDLVLDPSKLVSNFGHAMTYNPPWLTPILAPFMILPGKSGYIIFAAATLLMFWWVTRVFSGKFWLVLVSSQLFWIIWWGQIDGLVILGVGLGWEALRKRNITYMVLAMLLATLKPQIGLVPILAIWWWFGRSRWKALLWYGVIFLLTIGLYGLWPVWFVQSVIKVATRTEQSAWNTSLGLWALPLLIPALFIKMERYPRLISLIATALLISPYMPNYSTTILFCFGLPWWFVFFALLGYFPAFLTPQPTVNIIPILPISVLIWLYYPFVKNLLQNVLKRFNANISV
jgi:hypothetical protein